MRARVKAAVAVAAALAVLAGADTIVAANVERAVAQPGIQASVGGFPYTASLLTGKVARVSVEHLDAAVDGPGVATTGVDVFDLALDNPREALSGEFESGTARLVRRRVRLDGVGFGTLLGITDLDIANPYDISPAGGAASEARLTGTVPGTEDPVTVVVTLRLIDGIFQMRPSKLIDDTSPETQAAFTLDLDTRTLPLDGPADRVQLRGGSIEFSRDRINTAFDPADLNPMGQAATLGHHE